MEPVTTKTPRQTTKQGERPNQRAAAHPTVRKRAHQPGFASFLLSPLFAGEGASLSAHLLPPQRFAPVRGFARFDSPSPQHKEASGILQTPI